MLVVLALLGTAQAWEPDSLFFTIQNGRVYELQLSRDTDGLPIPGTPQLIHDMGDGVSPGVAVFQGDLYVVDAARGAVLRMSDADTIEDYATGLPSGFWELTDLSFEPDGTLYVSHTTQTGTGAVFIIPPNGGTGPFERLFGTTERPIRQPNGLTRDPITGILYVADVKGKSVLSYDPSTNEVATITTGLTEPVDLTTTCDGLLFVNEHAPRRVSRLDPSSGDLTVLFQPSSPPEAMTTDSSGWSYVGYNGGEIVRFNGDGTNALVIDLNQDIDGLTWYGGGDETVENTACPGVFDTDRDGVPDSMDVCVDTPDPNQEDGDGDGVGDACDTCFDADGDGAAPANEVNDSCASPDVDCDDSDADINTDATETPNDGIDQDCSGADTVSCFVDDDGDGIGDAPTTAEGDCSADGLADTDGDCDDNDPARTPGRDEVPNDGIDQDCSGADTVTCYLDSDGDGAGAAPTTGEGDCTADGLADTDGDCDDNDPERSPGHEEVVGDGVDQDCSGADAVTCYTDGDTDGIGDETTTGEGDCSADGLADTDGDCDDNDPARTPGRNEVLDDGIDQDCSGADTVTCYLDEDGDGIGHDHLAGHLDVSLQEGSCDAEGVSSRSDDCDDADATVNPDAAEIADDGIDQDCSGADTLTCYLDEDADGYGTTASTGEGQCDEGTATAGADCDDTDPAIHPGATEVCNGVDDDCLPSTDLDGTDGDSDEDGTLDCEQDLDDTGDTGELSETGDTGDTGDTGEQSLPGDSAGNPSNDRCGCAATSLPGTAGWLLLLAPLGWARRRR